MGNIAIRPTMIKMVQNTGFAYSPNAIRTLTVAVVVAFAMDISVRLGVIKIFPVVELILVVKVVKTTVGAYRMSLLKMDFV